MMTIPVLRSWLRTTRSSNRLEASAHYYIANPDASDENSAFRGENVLYLGDGNYYAHGIVGDSGTASLPKKK